MTNTEFRDLVTKMRNTQRCYFATRSKQVLEIAKILEKRVDTELKRVEDKDQISLDLKTT